MLRQFDKVMYVVGHNAQSVELEPVLLNGLFECIDEYLLALMVSELEFAVVAPGGDVVAVIGLEIS